MGKHSKKKQNANKRSTQKSNIDSLQPTESKKKKGGNLASKLPGSNQDKQTKMDSHKVVEKTGNSIVLGRNNNATLLGRARTINKYATRSSKLGLMPTGQGMQLPKGQPSANLVNKTVSTNECETGANILNADSDITLNFANVIPEYCMMDAVDNEVVVTVHAPEGEFGDSDVESDIEQEVSQNLNDSVMSAAIEKEAAEMLVTPISPPQPIYDNTTKKRDEWRRDPEFVKMLDEMVDARIRSRGILDTSQNKSGGKDVMSGKRRQCNPHIMKSPSESTVYVPALQLQESNDDQVLIEFLNL